ncbi:TPA: hypothetical protein IRQ07_005148, partial [Escherichia coli]|nr:hypothetical protein [Escherichia coli]
RFDEKQIKWREEVDRDYPREKVYILNPDNIPLREDNIKKSASNASKITVSVTVSKLCASQKEFDDFFTLAEKLKENSPGH